MCEQASSELVAVHFLCHPSSAKSKSMLSLQMKMILTARRHSLGPRKRLQSQQGSQSQSSGKQPDTAKDLHSSMLAASDFGWLNIWTHMALSFLLAKS